MQRLRFVSELPERYQHVFSDFNAFNFIQSSIMDFLMQTDMSLVVSAPTGSGKTTLFELAIIRLLETWEQSVDECNKEQKIVYMAPIKALCTEKFREWEKKFTSLGIRAIEITGDSDGSDLIIIQHFNLILTTPEKWDALTRKWKDHASLIQMIKLFLIDEVHLLNEDKRGPTLEVVVSRMKTVQETIDFNNDKNSWIRFIAVSATIPNIEDIAQWLSLKQSQAKIFKYGEEMRPVHLKRIVKAYSNNDDRRTGYKFDLYLNYKLKQLIMQYSEGKPTLIFCSSRKSVLTAANVLCEQILFQFTLDQRENIDAAAEFLQDHKLKEMVRHGVAYHHAGLLVSDRHCIEELFRSGYLPVLVSTSTLAMGVNLPASLVIIKSTEHYVCGGWQEYSEGQILQMVGRAGRPQFGDSATAIILTKDVNKEKYEKLVHGKEMVESSLHRHLIEHLNAEIVLGTITDIAVAMNWIRSTYLYVRALKNPKHYGIPIGLTSKEVEARLQDMCLRELHALENHQLVITSDLAYNVEATENGKLMAKYYIAFDTMKIFMMVKGTENLAEMLELLSQCHEFDDVQLRTNEKACLNLMNNQKEQEIIRFCLEGKIKTRQMKTNCLIQSVLGCMQISDPSLRQESVKIIRLAQRLLNGLSLYLWPKNFYQALASALILNKCVHARLWENSPFVCRQLPGIGSVLAAQLVSAKKNTFQSILESNPRDLERIINRKPPMGNQIQEAAAKIPQYEIEVTYSNNSDKKLIIILRILNALEVQYGNTLHRCSLLVANMNNLLLKKEKICDQAILAHGGEFQFSVYLRSHENLNEFIVHLISETLVGVDVKQQYKLVAGNLIKQTGKSAYESATTVKPKVSSKGKENKSSSNNKSKKSTKKNKSPNTCSKQIQSYLDKYNFIPKRREILKHSNNNCFTYDDNEVTSSTQDSNGRSVYFSSEYQSTNHNDQSTEDNVDQQRSSSIESAESLKLSSDRIQQDIVDINETDFISDEENDENCWKDSGIYSVDKSLASASESAQVICFKKHADQEINRTNIIESKDNSIVNQQRLPMLSSPSCYFSHNDENSQQSSHQPMRKYYPLLMPISSKSTENENEINYQQETNDSDEDEVYISEEFNQNDNIIEDKKESAEEQIEDTEIVHKDLDTTEIKDNVENVKMKIPEEGRKPVEKEPEEENLLNRTNSEWTPVDSLLGSPEDLTNQEETLNTNNFQKNAQLEETQKFNNQKTKTSTNNPFQCANLKDKKVENFTKYKTQSSKEFKESKKLNESNHFTEKCATLKENFTINNQNYDNLRKHVHDRVTSEENLHFDKENNTFERPRVDGINSFKYQNDTVSTKNENLFAQCIENENAQNITNKNTSFTANNNLSSNKVAQQSNKFSKDLGTDDCNNQKDLRRNKFLEYSITDKSYHFSNESSNSLSKNNQENDFLKEKFSGKQIMKSSDWIAGPSSSGTDTEERNRSFFGREITFGGNSKFDGNISSSAMKQITWEDQVQKNKDISLQSEDLSPLGFDVDKLLETPPDQNDKEPSTQSSPSSEENNMSIGNFHLPCTTDNESKFNQTSQYFDKQEPILKNNGKLEGSRDILLEKCRNAFKVQKAEDRFDSDNNRRSNEETEIPMSDVWPPRRLLQKIPSFQNLPLSNLINYEDNERSIINNRMKTSFSNVDKERNESTMITESQQNCLRDAYGDPFAPIYTSSTLNDIADSNSNDQKDITNKRNKNMAPINNVRQEFVTDPYRFEAGPSTKTKLSPVPSTSSAQWPNQSSQQKQLEFAPKPFLSQQFPPNAGKSFISGKISQLPLNSNQKDNSVGNRLFDDKRLQRKLDSVTGSTILKPIDKFNKFASTAYFKKIKPRHFVKPRFANFHKSQYGFKVNPNYFKTQINSDVQHTATADCSRISFTNQIQPTSLSNQSYANRMKYYHQQNMINTPMHSIQGNVWERTVVKRPKLQHIPQSLTCPLMMNSSQVYSINSNDDGDALNPNQFYMMPSNPMYYFDENRYLNEYNENQFMNPEYNYEPEQAGPSFTAPMFENLSTPNVHQMSPSPPMSGDEFEEIVNPAQYTSEPQQFQNFYFNNNNNDNVFFD